MKIQVLSCSDSIRYLRNLTAKIVNVKSNNLKDDEIRKYVVERSENIISFILHIRSCDNCAVWLWNSGNFGQLAPSIFSIKEYLRIPKCNRFEKELTANHKLRLCSSFKHELLSQGFGFHFFACQECSSKSLVYPKMKAVNFSAKIDFEKESPIDCTSFMQKTAFFGKCYNGISEDDDYLEKFAKHAVKNSEPYIALAKHARSCDRCAIWFFQQVHLEHGSLLPLELLSGFIRSDCNRFQEELRRNPDVFSEESTFFPHHPIWEKEMYSHPFGCHERLCKDCSDKVDAHLLQMWS